MVGPMTRLLTLLALALAGVTAASVGMAVHRLITDPVLAWMFCGAAVLLDVFKYAAWPLSADTARQGRVVLAGCLVACSLVFAAVSGWATFDRVAGAVQGRSAGSEQRLVDLSHLQATAEARVAQLDKQLTDIRKQAAWMRERGMVTKAQELEVEAVGRADAEREAEVGRLERVSNERKELLQSKGTTLPDWVVAALGLGFAIALEVVPVLLFLAGRAAPIEQLPVFTEVRESVVTEEPPKPVTPVVSEEPERIARSDKPADPPTADKDEELLEALRSDCSSNSLLKVKDFAKQNGVGNTRASALYKRAEQLGIIQKTPAGYIPA